MTVLGVLLGLAGGVLFAVAVVRAFQQPGEASDQDLDVVARSRAALEEARRLAAVRGARVVELERELRNRRACMVGAQQTLDEVAETLRNAQRVELTRTSLLPLVAERHRLLSCALASTDETLGDTAL